jgi:hypothetical protein
LIEVVRDALAAGNSEKSNVDLTSDKENVKTELNAVNECFKKSEDERFALLA